MLGQRRDRLQSLLLARPPPVHFELAAERGCLSHLVLDSLTGPIPWGWPFAARRVALVPAALRIRTGARIETWLLRPAITIAAVIAVLEVAGLPSLPR
jgi:hypothetical protein